MRAERPAVADAPLPVALGGAARLAGLPALPVALVHLQRTATTLVQAAQRLMPLGQVAAQGVLAALAPVAQAVAEAAEGLGPDLDLILIESGGDNLSATFSPELADVTVYVIDVAAGEEIPRKGGPAITRSDLLVISKTDLAPHVGASLEVMERDAARMRAGRPFLLAQMRHGRGVAEIVAQLRAPGGL